MIAMNLGTLRAALATCVFSALVAAGDVTPAPSVPPSPGAGSGPGGLEGSGPLLGNDGVGGIERKPYSQFRIPDDGNQTDGKPDVVMPGASSEFWQDLGEALTGSDGEPRLEGEGDAVAGNTILLRTEKALPGAPATLIIGFSQSMAPFKGGTLVPQSDLMLSGLQANDGGIIELPLTMPADLPAGATIYLQTWIVDDAAPAGAAASNGLAMTTGS